MSKHEQALEAWREKFGTQLEHGRMTPCREWFEAAYAQGVRDAAEKVRTDCKVCDGTGHGSRDEYHMDTECEYCGRPRAAILGLLPKAPDGP